MSLRNWLCFRIVMAWPTRWPLPLLLLPYAGDWAYQDEISTPPPAPTDTPPADADRKAD